MERFGFFADDTERDMSPHPASEEADAAISHTEFKISQEIELGRNLGANFSGDWTTLLYERLKDPKMKAKFIEFKRRFPPTENIDLSDYTEPDETKIRLSKRNTDLEKATYEATIQDYDVNLERVFRSTRYHYADNRTFDGSIIDDLNTHIPQNGGTSKGYGDEGSVFIDAKDKSGKEYNLRNKNLIEAHEKAHGVFGNLTTEEKKYLWGVFNHAKIGYPYKMNPEEILIRMTQVKNYFGFAGNEPMTVAKLRYARAHYIEDVGLDNNMVAFFNAITPENEVEVVKLMNEYPC